jgi:hypothetical protein
MGQSGRKRVEQSLAWEHSVSNLIAAYERVFQKRGWMGHNASVTTHSNPKSSLDNTNTQPQGSDELISERAEG